MACGRVVHGRHARRAHATPGVLVALVVNRHECAPDRLLPHLLLLLAFGSAEATLSVC
jgi:hypothetical protein